MRNLITDIITYLLIKVLNAGGKEMMAMLWAQRIMNEETIEAAKATYQRVPRLLKEKVKLILNESGMEEITAE